MTIQGISPSTGAWIGGTVSILANGTSVYSVNFATSTDSRGIFNLQLTNLSSTTFSSTGTYTIQFYMAGTTTTVPIQTVPFAYRAAMADNAASGGGDVILASTQTFSGGNLFASSFTVRSGGRDIILSTSPTQGVPSIIINGTSGQVGIAKENPTSILDVNGTVTAGTFSGSGANLTNIPDTALSSNVALLKSTQTFTGANTFTSSFTVTGQGQATALFNSSVTFNAPITVGVNSSGWPLSHVFVNPTAGNYTWTVPSGVAYFKVICIGGGGGGYSNQTGAGGGGGGTATSYIYNVTVSSVIAYTVGAGGAAGSSGNATTFGSYCQATGGVGGTLRTGGAGGYYNTANNGFGFRGGPGGFGITLSGVGNFGGGGGNTFMGGGAPSTFNATTGTAGYPYGGGGSAGTTGGAGATGAVIIEY